MYDGVHNTLCIGRGLVREFHGIVCTSVIKGVETLIDQHIHETNTYIPNYRAAQKKFQCCESETPSPPNQATGCVASAPVHPH